jgi:hypothetical protein
MAIFALPGLRAGGISKIISLPTLEPYSLIHFSNRNRKSNVTVNHILKISSRVERGDGEATDPLTKKPKLFDILVQMPVRILSVSSLRIFHFSTPF